MRRQPIPQPRCALTCTRLPRAVVQDTTPNNSCFYEAIGKEDDDWGGDSQSDEEGSVRGEDEYYMSEL